jgi:cobalt-zinc-cadmium efflux system protein
MPHHHSSHDHGHRSHHHHSPTNYDRAFTVGLALNGAFVVIEFGLGLLSNSVALMADAGHNLSDVLGLVLAWVATLLVRRQPSSHRTYGWRKSSILAALFNALFLLLVTGGIVWESVLRFFNPHEIDGGIVIMAAAIGIVINSLTAWMFLAGSKHDLNIRAAFQHMAADALVSVGVVFAGVGILWTHWLWLDGAFSLGISLFIIVNTWGLLTESFHLAIDGVPSHINERAVLDYLLGCGGVAQIHDLHIWNLSTVETALTAHLVIPDGHPGDQFLHDLSQELQSHFKIHHVTLQIEVGDSHQPCLTQNCNQYNQ